MPHLYIYIYIIMSFFPVTCHSTFWNGIQNVMLNRNNVWIFACFKYLEPIMCVTSNVSDKRSSTVNIVIKTLRCPDASVRDTIHYFEELFCLHYQQIMPQEFSDCGDRTYLLTPWCRVLPEQLTGLQLVKKFPAFHGTRRFITALTSVRHLSLSWASPIQSIYPHHTSWKSVLI